LEISCLCSFAMVEMFFSPSPNFSSSRLFMDLRDFFESACSFLPQRKQTNFFFFFSCSTLPTKFSTSSKSLWINIGPFSFFLLRHPSFLLVVVYLLSPLDSTLWRVVFDEIDGFPFVPSSCHHILLFLPSPNSSGAQKGSLFLSDASLFPFSLFWGAPLPL